MLEVVSDYSEDGLGRKWARWIAQVDADGLDGDHDEMRANARLIAAAPDLLAACKALLGVYFVTARCRWRHYDCQECAVGRTQEWQAMKAAIAKAEGTDAP